LLENRIALFQLFLAISLKLHPEVVVPRRHSQNVEKFGSLISSYSFKVIVLAVSAAIKSKKSESGGFAAQAVGIEVTSFTLSPLSPEKLIHVNINNLTLHSISGPYHKLLHFIVVIAQR